jgi:hypothetical protein
MLENKKIAIILGGTFPTSKAYGVTTRETLKVLREFGYDVKLFCYPSKYDDSDHIFTRDLIKYYKTNIFSKFMRKIASIKINKFNAIIFRVATTIDLLSNLKYIRNFAPDYIWTRDPISALICAVFLDTKKIAIEVHEKTKPVFYKFLKHYLNKIIFYPISNSNLYFLKSAISKKFNYRIAPMGIQKNSIVGKDEISKYLLRIKQRGSYSVKIAYIGRLRPTTYSKGVEDLIYLAKYLQFNKSNMSVTLLGASEYELKFYNRLKRDEQINNKYLKIKLHVPHSKAIKALQGFDILVLPRYDNENYSGMPIKLLEYLAAGKIIIYADSPIYNEFIPSKIRKFSYTAKDVKGLYNTILFSLQYEHLDKLITSGIRFASKFTWEYRTFIVTSGLHGRNDSSKLNS